MNSERNWSYLIEFFFFRQEIKQVRKALTIKGQTENVIFISSKLIVFVITLVYYYTGNTVTANVAVKLLTWTETLRMLSLMLSMSAQFTTEMYMSLGRIHGFLIAEEMEDDVEINKITQEGDVSLNKVTSSWAVSQKQDSKSGDTDSESEVIHNDCMKMKIIT